MGGKDYCPILDLFIQKHISLKIKSFFKPSFFKGKYWNCQPPSKKEEVKTSIIFFLELLKCSGLESFSLLKKY
jgi:hypothetical protein